MNETQGSATDRHTLRSAKWFAGDDMPAFIHRSAMRSAGFSRLAFEGRPIVGICNSWSEVVSCNMHFQGAGRLGATRGSGGRRLPIGVPDDVAR